MRTELRVIDANDWEEFRALRLRALADSPDSFGATLADASAQEPSVWRDRATSGGPVVLASAGRRSIGMGGLYLPEAAEDAFVWGMWVEPPARGRGVATRILERLLGHADQEGRPVTLHVTCGNDAARLLYERHGFEATGEVQPCGKAHPSAPPRCAGGCRPNRPEGRGPKGRSCLRASALLVNAPLTGLWEGLDTGPGGRARYSQGSPSKAIDTQSGRV